MQSPELENVEIRATGHQALDTNSGLGFFKYPTKQGWRWPTGEITEPEIAETNKNSVLSRLKEPRPAIYIIEKKKFFFSTLKI